MTEIGYLLDTPPREAWPHEAHDFTPWLAANIDRLTEVIGIPLQIEGTEVAVETFSADILARNSVDGSLVLIENQLEGTNHTLNLPPSPGPDAKLARASGGQNGKAGTASFQRRVQGGDGWAA